MMDLCLTLAALTTLCNKAIDHLATVVAPCRLLEVDNLEVVNTCNDRNQGKGCLCTIENLFWHITQEVQLYL